jgi:hypothetical protein
MASYVTDRQVLFIKTFYSSGGPFVPVERQYHREFSSLMFHRRETLTTGLLNSLKQQEVRVVKVKRDVNAAQQYSH